MGLTARDMGDMGRLAALAAKPEDVSREEIYLAVASLYRVQGPYLSGRERELMRDILRHLTQDVEMAVRISLAERLADDSTVPHELILLLADDTIEVARPLILRSALFTDDDALRLISEASSRHQETIAERPNIGEAVTDALVKKGDESVLVALVRNVSARIATLTYESLVAKSQAYTKLQEPLAHRPDLPPVLATKMCEWVSDGLKAHIARNYTVSDTTIARALNGVHRSLGEPASGPSANPGDGAQKLIEKLASAGQLKAGFLMRVLHQGQSDLFDLGFARLLELSLADARKTLYESGPQAVALACRAAGIDISVFKTIYTLSRRAHNLSPVLTTDQLAQAEAVFNTYRNKAAALARLHERVGWVSAKG